MPLIKSATFLCSHFYIHTILISRLYGYCKNIYFRANDIFLNGSIKSYRLLENAHVYSSGFYLALEDRTAGEERLVSALNSTITRLQNEKRHRSQAIRRCQRVRGAINDIRSSIPTPVTEVPAMLVNALQQFYEVQNIQNNIIDFKKP